VPLESGHLDGLGFLQAKKVAEKRMPQEERNATTSAMVKERFAKSRWRFFRM